MKIGRHKDTLKKQGDRYYHIYEHYADGVLFYVGKGCDRRWLDHSSRNAEWNKIAEQATLVEAKIVAWRNEEADALNTERSIYLQHINSGVETLTNANPPVGLTREVEVKVLDTETVKRLKEEIEIWKDRAETNRSMRQQSQENNLRLMKHRSFLLDELIEAKEKAKKFNNSLFK